VKEKEGKRENIMIDILELWELSLKSVMYDIQGADLRYVE